MFCAEKVLSSTYWKLPLKARSCWICCGDLVARSGSEATAFIAFTTPMYSLYAGTSFIAMYAKNPAMARTNTNPIRVMPCCFFMGEPLQRNRRRESSSSPCQWNAGKCAFKRRSQWFTDGIRYATSRLHSMQDRADAFQIRQAEP